jgi:hypothetical protein
MALLPATGTEIVMGRVSKGYNNVTPTASPNLLSNPTLEVNGTTSEFVQYADLAPIFNRYGTNVTYSLSLDLKATIPGSVHVYMQNGSYTKYSFVANSVNVTTVYQRFTFNGLTAAISTPSETEAILAFYTGYGSGIIPSIKNVQVEISPVATAFNSNTASHISLSGTLGGFVGQAASTQITLSSRFGGQTTPYAY